MKLKQIVILAALASTAAVSFAQDGPPGGGGPGGAPPGFRVGPGFGPGRNSLAHPEMLAMRPDVQADLGLTDDQKSQLEKLRESMRPPGGGPGGGFGGPGGPPPGGGQDGGPGGPPPDGGGGPGGPPPGGGPGGPPPDGGGPGGPDGGFGGFQQMQPKLSTKIDEILTADQKSRVKQIAIQLAGNRAVVDPSVQSTLSMTAEQKAKVKELVEGEQAAARSIFEKAQNQEIDREEVRPLLQKNSKIMDDSLSNILTESQKAKLKALGGKPFMPENPEGGQG